MSAIVEERKLGGPGTLALTLLFIAPSAIALFASFALSHQARFSASALWFVYEVSLLVGCATVGVAAISGIIKSVRRQISPMFRWLVGISVLIGVFLLWYARHIFQNPWIPNS
jgi:chromate transport protein ChrA